MSDGLINLPKNPIMANAFKEAMANIGIKPEKRCKHQYKKTLAKSGMYFILKCQKCSSEKPFIECVECKK